MVLPAVSMLIPTPDQMKALVKMAHPSGNYVLFVRRDEQGQTRTSIVKNKKNFRGATRISVDETIVFLSSGWVKPAAQLLAGKPYYYEISTAGRQLVEARQQHRKTKGGL